MSKTILKVEHITKSYQDGSGKNLVLNDVSLDVGGGKLVAIVGPSGSGKSTFLTIAGMLLSPDAGAITINGERVSDSKKKNWTKVVVSDII